MTRETLILTAADVAASITMSECIDAVEAAFAGWGRGEVDAPGVLGVHVPGGGFHIKAAAYRPGRHYFAAKTNGNFPANPELHRLPSIQGVLVLCDADNGTPLAVMDSISITELRTAAATAVAARYLAREGAGVVTLIGCGAQAASQLRALSAVLSLEEVWVSDLDAHRASAFAGRMSAELGVPVRRAEDMAAALAASAVCVTCTTSRAPVLGPGAVSPGAFIAAVGADNHDKHEIHPSLLRDSKIVVDSLEQCSAFGDLHHALAAGVVRSEDVHAELAQIVAGNIDGRTNEDEVIVFDSTGTALQDVASAALIYARAVETGRGVRIALA